MSDVWRWILSLGHSPQTLSLGGFPQALGIFTKYMLWVLDLRL
jgi:hypothetical protein